MKKAIIILILMLINFTTSAQNNKDGEIENLINQGQYQNIIEEYVEETINIDTLAYQIKSINTCGAVYVIKAERDEVEYTILTENDDVSNFLCRHPIKVGESYPLILENEEITNGVNKSKYPGIYISGIIYNGTSISFEKFPRPLYFTSSLKGLCLLKDSKLPGVDIKQK